MWLIPRRALVPQDDYKVVKEEIPAQRRARVAEKKTAEHTAKLALDVEAFKPHENEDATEDAFKTLFIGRLSHTVDDKKLKREMERYGPVKKIRVVMDKESGKPKGYAFVEFEDERDMKVAYKQADGIKIDDMREYTSNPQRNLISREIAESLLWLQVLSWMSSAGVR